MNIKTILNIVVILIGVLGVWLLYWNLTDFMVTGLDTQIWDWSILEEGINSIVVGIILIGIVLWRGIHVLI